MSLSIQLGKGEITMFDDALTISVNYGPVDATFKGKFCKDGKSFSGGWRPNPDADETSTCRMILGEHG
jgi:hypothetical protein